LSVAQTEPNPTTPIDPATAALIRRKAARMVGRAGLRVQDREDLEQELALHILEREGAFDVRRGSWHAFARHVVDRHGENIVRSRRAKKRYGGPEERLTEEIPAPPTEAEVPVHVVATALATLPEKLRRVAELVMEGTVTAAAKALGISRSTVYARLREIRDRSEFQKLAENLSGLPDTLRANGE
jgi:RNA polymerase sigma factor (sigma-70 family)